LDDQARRAGQAGTDRTSKIPKIPSRANSFQSTKLPDSVPEVPEDALEDDETMADEAISEKPDNGLGTPKADLTPKAMTIELPSFKWGWLRHLCLAENALTFIPSTPLAYLTSLTHLDLSSNLLVSVPPGLAQLYSLVYLNLSDNMIDSVLGIYTHLGQVLTLNIARNRLESICGLERLLALERVDLRNNLIEESAEVGRLATLPNIGEIWVEGNPLTEVEEGYRIRCFDLFWKERKSILLDGSPPGFYEKRHLASPTREQMSSSRPVSAYSPAVVAINSPPPTNGLATATNSAPSVSSHSPQISPPVSSPPSHASSPQLAPVRGRRKKNKRIVDLDGGSDGGIRSRSNSHSRRASDAGWSPALAAHAHVLSPPKGSMLKPSLLEAPIAPVVKREPSPIAGPSTFVRSESPEADPSLMDSVATIVPPLPKLQTISKHSRHRTEFVPSSSSFLDNEPVSPLQSFDDKSSRRRSATLSSRSAARRARVTASVYEPPGAIGSGNGTQPIDEAEAFRARIEALRSDMGDGWLKVFNQSQLGSPPAKPSGVSSS